MSRVRRVVVSAVFLLAAAARLWRLDLVEWKYDQAETVEMLVRNGGWTAVGLRGSTGWPHGPGHLWVTAPAAWVSDDPLVLSAWTALLGSIGVGVFTAATARLVGAGPAFAAGLLFAVSPWAVVFSRAVWAPNTMGFEGAFLWAAIVARSAGARGAAAAVGGCLGLLHVSHLASIPLAVPAAAALGRDRRAWAAALAAYALPAGLFLVGLRWTGERIETVGGSIETRWAWAADPLRLLPWALAGPAALDEIAGPPPFGLWSVGGTILAAGLALVGLARAWRSGGAERIAAIWVGAVGAFVLLLPAAAQVHYAFPVQAGLFAVVASAARSSRAAAAVCALVAALDVAAVAAIARRADAGETRPTVYGLPLRDVTAVGRAVAAVAEGEPVHVRGPEPAPWLDAPFLYEARRAGARLAPRSADRGALLRCPGRPPIAPPEGYEVAGPPVEAGGCSVTPLRRDRT